MSLEESYSEAKIIVNIIIKIIIIKIIFNITISSALFFINDAPDSNL